MGVAGQDRTAPDENSAALLSALQLLGTNELDVMAMMRVADELPLMFAFFDRDMRIAFANRAGAEALELAREDVIGKRLGEIGIGENRGRHRPALESALNGRRQRFIETFDHPTRGRITIAAEYIPHFGSDGAVVGAIGIAQDLTEQRATEVALRESEARFRRIADSAPAPMWVSRVDRSREFVNQAFAEFFGISRDRAGRMRWRTFLHPDDADQVLSIARFAENARVPHTTLGRYRRQDGMWRWLHIVSQPRTDEEGRFLGFIGVATDVTVAKEAELELRRLVDERTTELRESEQRFRAMFGTVLEIIVLMKPDGTIIDSNYGSQAPDGATRSGIGMPVWDSPAVLPFDNYREALRHAVAAAAAGESFSQEVGLDRIGRPGSTFDISLQPVRDSQNEIIYLLLEARDITELKAAQEQLRQSQKMEALGQLTGGIAHDFNNLLTVVVGGLDLIAKRAEDEKLKRYAANALAAAERGAKLTAQLLAFSRVQRLEVRPTRIAPLIEHIEPLIRNVIGPSIDLRFEPRDGAVAVMADPTQLELAVLNLAINARDAMPDGGTLRIRLRQVKVAGDSELEDGNYVELSIRDTGAGMSPDVQARAFEPFFTTKEVGKGTGLGLSMVYGVARQSGGIARIRSGTGRGTTVRLYFPFAEAQAACAADAAGRLLPLDETEQPSASRVLVVDDDPDVRAFIVSSLEEMGYTVTGAADGPAGLARFAEQPPDLVILDYAMPELSGAEVAQQMLERRPGQPILFVSGYRETEAIRRTAPDAPLLTKPFRADALGSAVHHALGIREPVVPG